MTPSSPPARESGEETGTGRLYVVATPIGNLEDISLRALRILRECDLIAAEDTRRTRKLLSHFDIHTPLTSFFQHSQQSRAPGIVARIQGGLSVSLVTDAGTPGISDPGAVLVRLALDAGLEVTAIPGPSAVVTLLSLSGLPADRFIFEGFLPPKEGRKRRRLEELSQEPRTLVFYESPHRLEKTLRLMGEVFGDRKAAVGRELTKVFEEIRRGSLTELAGHFGGGRTKGEVTIAVEGVGKKKRAGEGRP